MLGGVVIAALTLGTPPAVNAAEASWRVVPGSAPGVTHAAAAMDTRRHRLLLYGGRLGRTAGHGLFALDPATETWNAVLLAGETPPALPAASAAYDSIHDRLLLIGSDTDVPAAPLGCWAIELQSTPFIHRLEAIGEAPSARSEHVALFDPDQQRVLVHGGRVGQGLSAELYQLSLDPQPSWTRLEPGGYVPPPVADHAGVYDPTDSSFVIWGGAATLANDGARERGLREASSSAPAHRLRFNKLGPVWELLDLPGPLFGGGARAVLDPTHRCMVVVGAYSPWSWSLGLGEPAAWSPHAAAPWVGGGAALGADPVEDRLLVHGALSTWRAALGAPDSAWSQVAPRASGPLGLSMHVGFFDPIGSALLLFGGWDGASRNDLWSFTADSGWTRANPAVGSRPAARYFPAWAYVPSRDALWLFGGQSQQAPFGDCYELPLRSGTGWRQVAACGQAPSARTGTALAYSPASDALLLFGGSTDMAGHTPDSAAYVLRPGPGSPCWSRVAARGPSGRFLHTLVFDSRRNRALCFGGIAADDRCWAFSFASNAWSVVVPEGPGPGPRWKHVAAYDESGDRMLVFGGDGSASSQELWALEFSPSIRWRKLGTNGDAGTLAEGAGGFDVAGSRLLTHGGDFPGFYECRLVRAGELAVEPGQPDAARARVLRNPSPGAWVLEVEGLPGDRVRADLFDVGGRRLESRALLAGADGQARLTLDAGRRCRPGLYFARVECGRRHRVVRLVRAD